jgi:hypothetical protein
MKKNNIFSCYRAVRKGYGHGDRVREFKTLKEARDYARSTTIDDIYRVELTDYGSEELSAMAHPCNISSKGKK